MGKKHAIALGISFSHGDSAAALVVNGTLVAAAEEERFTRIKHYALFPSQAIQYCLKHAGLSPQEVQSVAIAKLPRNAILKKLSLLLRYPKAVRTKQSAVAKKAKEHSLSENLFQLGLGKAKVHRYEHHLAHLMSARYLTKDDDAALFSFDGLGDFVSTAFGQATPDGAKIWGRLYYPHSLGFFYTAMTQYLGFPYFGDEFKVMGLSACGKPSYLEEVRQLVRVADNGQLGFELNLEAFPVSKTLGGFSIKGSQPHVLPLFQSSFLTQLIGLPPRKITEPIRQEHKDLAKSVQCRFEEIASHCLKQLYKRVPSETLGLAGGCAHNSVWVGKIREQTPFKKVLVAPACHDAGIAVGAAILSSGERIVAEGKHWALLGPSHHDSQTDPNTRFSFQVEEHSFPDRAQLLQWMVKELAAKKILGVFHGRMEFGPRALGHRSILADPRVADMKDRLNKRVKHRESFRPFAASVLWEEQQNWFKDSFYAPTMEAVFEVHETKRAKIPAVVHEDNSCRIQSVTKETQPFMWELINTFKNETKVPLLINTSFNDCEPVVCTPDDALRCFGKTDLDHLVLENKVFSRSGKAKLAHTG